MNSIINCCSAIWQDTCWPIVVRNYIDVNCATRDLAPVRPGRNKLWKNRKQHKDIYGGCVTFISRTIVLFVNKLWVIPFSLEWYENMQFRMELGQGLIGGFSARRHGLSVKHGVDFNILENINGHAFVRLPVKRPRVCRGHKRVFPDERVREVVYDCSTCQVHYCKACFLKAHSAI